VPSLRHVLSAATCAALAVVGLAACTGKPDATALPTAAGATVASTTSAAAPTSAPPTATPTSESAAPTVRVTVGTAPTTTPKRRAASPTTPSATKAPSTAPPAPTSRPAPAAPADTSVAGQVLALVNTERARAGCEPVALDGRLAKAAAGHSQDMATDNFLSHDSEDGRDFADRIKATGYPAPRSENIAAGQRTPSAVMDAWMHSAGHKANILDCTATQMGLASATGGDFGIYWTQDFGTA
jgi:uncharacterized protein YkwD